MDKIKQTKITVEQADEIWEDENDYMRSNLSWHHKQTGETHYCKEHLELGLKAYDAMWELLAALRKINDIGLYNKFLGEMKLEIDMQLEMALSPEDK